MTFHPHLNPLPSREREKDLIEIPNGALLPKETSRITLARKLVIAPFCKYNYVGENPACTIFNEHSQLIRNND